jgi:hypothetical protein
MIRSEKMEADNELNSKTAVFTGYVAITMPGI